MKFQIRVTQQFSAAHQLRLYDGSLEPMHGHNWRVQVTVGSDRLDEIGVVMDFHVLEAAMADIARGFHNRHLNETAAFAARNPSAENVAVHFAEQLGLPDGVKLLMVEVWETDTCCAVYRAGGRD